MKSSLANLRSPAIIGLILVLPFILLELVNRRNFHEGFPFPLFGILWLLAITFIVTVVPVLRSLRAGNKLMANPLGLLLRTALLVLSAWMWTGIVLDQMPCFLGVLNCD